MLKNSKKINTELIQFAYIGKLASQLEHQLVNNIQAYDIVHGDNNPYENFLLNYFNDHQNFSDLVEEAKKITTKMQSK